MKACFFLLSIWCTGIVRVSAQAGEWTWMNGSNNVNNAPPVFGTKGIPSPLNTPPGFYEPSEWQDQDGKFWLYGGFYGGSPSGCYGDVWKYDPLSNEWTWMHGAGTANPAPVFGTKGVAAPGNSPGGTHWCSATWVDTAGIFWLFGGSNGSGSSSSILWKYDPVINQWTWMNGPTVGGQPGVFGVQGIPDPANYPPSRWETNAAWTDNYNNLWLLGGLGFNGDDLWKYDISLNQWAWMKGSAGGTNPVYGTLGVPGPNNTPGDRQVYAKWKDANGDLWTFGGSGNRNDLWRYSIGINQWTWMGGPNTTNGDGVYGAQCVTDKTFLPSARHENRACWKDADGNFWTFGGYDGSVYNDLWKFCPDSLSWTWISGSQQANVAGIYGTKGVSAPTNIPGARMGSVGWLDASGSLWLYGGWVGIGQAGNDLWRFVPDPACGLQSCAEVLLAAAFNVSDTAVCEASCIDFYDQSLSGPTSWLWSFPGGNPSTSTDQHPVGICYSAAGSYDVTLIVGDGFSNDTINLVAFITVQPAPVAGITATGNLLSSSSAASYQWFLDGQPINGATSQDYSANQSGLYSVEITDSNGCNAAADYLFSAVLFQASDTSLCEKFCIDFLDQSLNSPVAWLWNFEGGLPGTSSLQNPSGICYDDPGFFDVMLITTDISGNQDTLLWNDYITVNQNPFAPVITQNGNTLTSSAAGSYQWQLNGSLIPGATDQSYVITESGVYTVVITDENGCQAQSSIKATITGIGDEEGTPGILIFPNPTKDILQIFITGYAGQGPWSIRLFNALGQELIHQEAATNGEGLAVSLKAFPSGIYYLQIGSDEHMMRKKVQLIH